MVSEKRTCCYHVLLCLKSFPRRHLHYVDEIYGESNNFGLSVNTALEITGTIRGSLKES